MAKVTNQDIPSTDVQSSQDPARPFTMGEAYQQAITEGYPGNTRGGEMIVRKSPKIGRPSERGPGTAAQSPVRNCMKACGALWRASPLYYRNCVKQVYNDRTPAPKNKQIHPEWFSTPWSTFLSECMKACLADGPDNLNRGTLFNCPDTRCSGAHIGYTTNIMTPGTSQSLTIVNPNSEGSYGWGIAQGGGAITENGVYMAPSSNPDCQYNVSVVLTCYGSIVDTLHIAISTGNALAGYVNFKCSNYRADYQCSVQIIAQKFYCDGSVSVEWYPCSPWAPIVPCSVEESDGIWAWQCEERWDDINCMEDLRTESQKAAGCCPPQLF